MCWKPIITIPWKRTPMGTWILRRICLIFGICNLYIHKYILSLVQRNIPGFSFFTDDTLHGIFNDKNKIHKTRYPTFDDILFNFCYLDKDAEPGSCWSIVLRDLRRGLLGLRGECAWWYTEDSHQAQGAGYATTAGLTIIITS